MRKTYLIKMQKNQDTSILAKSFFYHKPFFMTLKGMIAKIIDLYPDYQFTDIKRVK